mmetsp:Transcript_5153/g.14457  ORF Transcript_5153/g.14457 Transcript_5153/m.14457 type:complete len:218 (-) Transcript_5153:558-1211(-)
MARNVCPGCTPGGISATLGIRSKPITVTVPTASMGTKTSRSCSTSPSTTVTFSVCPGTASSGTRQNQTKSSAPTNRTLSPGFAPSGTVTLTHSSPGNGEASSSGVGSAPESIGIGRGSGLSAAGSTPCHPGRFQWCGKTLEDSGVSPTTGCAICAQASKACPGFKPFGILTRNGWLSNPDTQMSSPDLASRGTVIICGCTTVPSITIAWKHSPTGTP